MYLTCYLNKYRWMHCCFLPRVITKATRKHSNSMRTTVTTRCHSREGVLKLTRISSDHRQIYLQEGGSQHRSDVLIFLIEAKIEPDGDLGINRWFLTTFLSQQLMTDTRIFTLHSAICVVNRIHGFQFGSILEYNIKIQYNIKILWKTNWIGYCWIYFSTFFPCDNMQLLQKDAEEQINVFGFRTDSLSF